MQRLNFEQQAAKIILQNPSLSNSSNYLHNLEDGEGVKAYHQPEDVV
jgi:hypothetical protein